MDWFDNIKPLKVKAKRPRRTMVIASMVSAVILTVGIVAGNMIAQHTGSGVNAADCVTECTPEMVTPKSVNEQLAGGADSNADAADNEVDGVASGSVTKGAKDGEEKTEEKAEGGAEEDSGDDEEKSDDTDNVDGADDADGESENAEDDSSKILLEVSEALVWDKQYDENLNANVKKVTFYDTVKEMALDETELKPGVDYTAVAKFADVSPGSNKDVVVTVSLTSSVAAQKYKLKNNKVATKASITKIGLAVTGAVASNKAFDGNVGANVSQVTFDKDFPICTSQYEAVGVFDTAEPGLDKRVSVVVALRGSALMFCDLTNNIATTTAIIYPDMEITRDPGVYTVKITGEHVSTDPSGSMVVSKGDGVTVNLTPEKGYVLSSVMVNNEDKLVEVKANQLTVENITRDTQIVVTAKPTVYNLIEGTGQVYEVGASKFLHLRFDADYEKFENGGEVYIDGHLLDKKWYTTKPGSTIIEVSGEYLDSMDSGDHVISAAFNDGGTGGTTFKLARSNVDIPGGQSTSDGAVTIGAPNTGAVIRRIIGATLSFTIFPLLCFGVYYLIKRIREKKATKIKQVD